MARTVSRYYLRDARGRRFITALIPALGKSAGVHKTYALRGIHIPPFLIASITSQCNLQCSGCYARAKECAGTALSEDMTTSEWRRIFQEAADIGVSFILIAGGEPLMRRDVLLSLAASFPGMVFPTFTNATLVDESCLQFFDAHRNVIPIPSIEGSGEETDRRRGAGSSCSSGGGSVPWSVVWRFPHGHGGKFPGGHLPPIRLLRICGRQAAVL